MSEEVFMAIGDREAIATLRNYLDRERESRARWQQRARRAEAERDAARADVAALLDANKIVRKEYNATLAANLPDAQAMARQLRWPIGHMALVAETHPSGANLLAARDALLDQIRRAAEHLPGNPDAAEAVLSRILEER